MILTINERTKVSLYQPKYSNISMGKIWIPPQFNRAYGEIGIEFIVEKQLSKQTKNKK